MTLEKIDDLCNKYFDTDVVCHVECMTHPGDKVQTWGCGFTTTLDCGTVEVEMVMVPQDMMTVFTDCLDECNIEWK